MHAKLLRWKRLFCLRSTHAEDPHLCSLPSRAQPQGRQSCSDTTDGQSSRQTHTGHPLGLQCRSWYHPMSTSVMWGMAPYPFLLLRQKWTEEEIPGRAVGLWDGGLGKRTDDCLWWGLWLELQVALPGKQTSLGRWEVPTAARTL